MASLETGKGHGSEFLISKKHKSIMKIKTTVLIMSLVLASTVFAIKMLPFPGWSEVERLSTDIIIARCLKTTDSPSGGFQGLIGSEINVVMVLKGQTNQGTVRLRSRYWPRPNVQYAIFSEFHDGVYDAIEPYRVIPLGTYFSTNSLTGKKLEDQISTLLQWRLDQLKREIEQNVEEKQRLEEGIGK